MNVAHLSPLANHLWQSTLFAATAGLLTFAFRKNRATVRYWIWFSASVKFLILFSLLVSLGTLMGTQPAPGPRNGGFSFAINEISQPFEAPPNLSTTNVTPKLDPMALLIGVWLCGSTIAGAFWVRSSWQIRAIRRAARPLPLHLPIKVMSSTSRLEPGVIGIREPVLLLPDGIMERLTPSQLEAVLAHELCHVHRRDNLTAAIHMLVEIIFWFHPFVWWIRAKLIVERERACDEQVIATINDPQDYAEGILNICKLYLESPLACMSGITGADLRSELR